jgi:conjugative relaxase-like TrwC/TraI family protein
MMSIHAFSCAAGYRAYVEKESPGYWVGTGAERLKLAGEVTPETFRSIRLGLHPETGEKLRIREVSDRIYKKPWGLETYKAREMYDLVISAPKSASILALMDDRISAAHEQAVEQTWRHMESRCGAMVIASYQHDTSRTLDPQTHTHLVAGNLAYDGSRWRTLHANEWYRRQEQITVHYRERLFERLEGYGYRIQYPELAGVSPEIMERFSQRSQERDREIEKFTERNHVAPTTREVSILVRESRGNKLRLPKEEIRERQLERLTPSERIQLTDVRERARERVSRPLMDHVESEPGLRVRPWSYGREIKPDAWG